MATHSRWRQAQSYEKAFWQGLSTRIEDGQFDLSWYDWNAKNLLRMLGEALHDQDVSFTSGRVLEVGSGPIGIVSHFEAAERHAVDPLNDFFASQPALVQHRNSGVTYGSARGEELPFEDNYFDLIIIENVIDHVQNADGVMRELHRVLKPDALLYLAVNLHPSWGAFVHRIVSALRIDKGHPHTFTIRGIRQFLKGHRFNVLHDEWQDYKECRRQDLKSDSTRDKLKGISGLSEFLYSSISRSSETAT